MKKIFRFFAERHLLAIIFTAIILLLGVRAISDVQREELPKVEFNVMFVFAAYPNASPEDVEINVTNKIEDELKGLNGIDYYESFSNENSSLVLIFLEPDLTDVDTVKQDIRDAVSRVSGLPSEVEKPVAKQFKISEEAIFKFGIFGNLPYQEIRNLADTFEEKLLKVDGVSIIEKNGYLDREIKITVNSEKLLKHKIALSSIILAIQARNIRSAAGNLESYSNEKNIVTLAQFRSPKEVGKVVLSANFEGPIVLIDDIATIEDGFEETDTISRFNGKQGISFGIKKKETADVIRTVDAIKKTLQELEENLPPEISLVQIEDNSDFVRNRLQVVLKNGAIGLILVLVLLGLFMNLKSAFWVGLSIPVTLLGTVFLLYVTGETINAIALAGMILVLGIVVDDSIIVAENIYTHRQKGKPATQAILDALKEVYPPVVTTILTTLLAFGAMFFISGTIGKFVYVIPFVVTCALLISLLEVTIALPPHVGSAIGKKELKQKKWVLFLEKKFYQYIKFVLKIRYLTVFIFLMILVGSGILAVKKLKFNLFPSISSKQISASVKLPLGSSIKASSDVVAEVEKIIASLPKNELQTFISTIGKTGGNFGSLKSNESQIRIVLTPETERKRSSAEIVEELEQKVKSIQAAEKISFRVVSEGPGGVERDVSLRLVSSNNAKKLAASNRLEEILREIKGVKNIDRNDKAGKPQLEIKLDYSKMARLGISVSTVSRNLRIALNGETATSVRYGKDDVDFRVIVEKGIRSNSQSLKNLRIPNLTGQLIPLYQFAKFVYVDSPAEFWHYNGERATTISADVDDKVTTSGEANQKAIESLDIAKNFPEVRLELAGEAKEDRESLISLAKTFIIAIAAIYLLLVILFNSLFQPFLVLLAVPFGIVGVIVAFYLHRMNLSFLALLGTIGMAGVVINDSLVLVNHINQKLKKNSEENILKTVAIGTKERFRAVILTTLTTVAGLLPLAYGLGGSDEFLKPMTLSMGYGLLFATFITLGLLPCMYSIGADIKNFLTKVKSFLLNSFVFLYSKKSKK